MGRHAFRSTADVSAQSTTIHDPAFHVSSIELQSLRPSFPLENEGVPSDDSLLNEVDRRDADLLRLATRLWPRSVFDSAKSVQTQTKQTAKTSACSRSHDSHGSHPPHAGASPEPQQDDKHASKTMRKEIMQPAKDFGIAAFYTAADKIGIPAPLTHLGRYMGNNASAALSALGQIIDENGLSTQGTTPLRRPKRSAGFIDPTMIAVPIFPRPSSLRMDVRRCGSPVPAALSRHKAPDDAICTTGLGTSALPTESTFLASHGDMATQSNADACSLVIQSLKDTQDILTSEWRNRQQSNACMSDMFQKFGVLPRTCRGISLQEGKPRFPLCSNRSLTVGNGAAALHTAEYEAALELICWTFSEEQSQKDITAFDRECGIKVDALIVHFHELVTGEN